MNANEMLANVGEHGEEAASDYNYGLDGWFGWRIAGDLLTVTWMPADEDGAAGPFESRSWRLVPVQS